jgi:hypothetical protein
MAQAPPTKVWASPGDEAPWAPPEAQSLSVALSQPAGQQPSPLLQAVMAERLQAALQLAALPVSTSTVQAFPSSQVVGQLEGGSHVSPLSTWPLPQVAEQSLSVAWSHPGGQQPSPLLQALMGAWLQDALQDAALPVSVSMVQAFPSSQLAGQLEGGSHVSPLSTWPLPQVAEQSPSEVLLHPGGQHPSLLLQAVVGAWLQAALQLAALPVSTSTVQAFPSSQVVGQLEDGSQVSPASTLPLPQLAEQSPSVVLSQPAGQQPSPLLQAVMGLWLHVTLQVAALPVSASTVQEFPSSQAVGQLKGGSQVSPVSTVLLPQTAPPATTPLVSSEGLPAPSGHVDSTVT